MKKYIIIFDLPRENAVLRVRVNRALKLTKCEKIQNSVWRSRKLDDLKGIAELIKKEGGSALILEWKEVE